MKILHISETTTAYMPARFVDLINRYTEHEAKLIQFKDFFLGNPLNIKRITSPEEITKALDWADILHYHTVHPYRNAQIRGVRITPRNMNKPHVFHYHGSPYRERHKKFNSFRPLLLSTPEMCPLFPGGTFFPNLIDESSDLYLERPINQRGKLTPIRVCHHFSLHSHLKDTRIFQDIQVNNRNGKMEFIYLDKMELGETLRKRAECDFVFDHLQGYYGLVSIEAMAQGVGTINGATEETMKTLHEFFGAVPPFIVANRNNISWVIQTLSKEMADEYGALGKKFMREYWSGAKNVHRLIDYYKGL